MIKLFSDSWKDYELIDAGNGKKLERFGNIITIRPEVQAYFKSVKSPEEWLALSHFEFIENDNTKGVWKQLKDFSLDYSWNIEFEKIKLQLSLTQFKHVGIFPEQADNWRFIQNHISKGNNFLNLFAYTGMASIVAFQKGAETTHVDAVKQLISWAKTNMELSQLDGIKWVLEDAVKFAEKEVRRNHKYSGIIMDPPAFGYGAKGERWLLDKKLPHLLELASNLLAPKGFLIINTYSPKIDSDTLKRLSLQHFQAQEIQIYELWMKATTGKKLYYGNLLRIEKI